MSSADIYFLRSRAATIWDTALGVATLPSADESPLMGLWPRVVQLPGLSHASVLRICGKMMDARSLT